MKVKNLTARGLTNMCKQSMKHGQNKFIVKNQQKT
jgi:hypothetical protein